MDVRRTAFLIVWLIVDVVLFLASYALAYFVRVGWILSTDFPFGRFMTVVVAVSPVLIFSLIITRTFGLTREQASPRNFAYILYSNILATAFFALGYYSLYGLFFSRLLLFVALAFSIVSLTVWHVLAGYLQRIYLRRSPAVFPTLIVGATRESRRFIETLEKNKNPLKPVAIIDGSGTKEKEICGVPVVGKLNRLEETLKKYKITHLVQCSELEQSINLLGVCRAFGITYLLLPSVLGIVERDESIEAVEGHSVTVVSPERGRWQWFFR